MQTLTQLTESCVTSGFFVHKVAFAQQVLGILVFVFYKSVQVCCQVAGRFEPVRMDVGAVREEAFVICAAHDNRHDVYAFKEHVEELFGDEILTEGALEAEVEIVLSGQHFKTGEALLAGHVSARAVHVHPNVLLQFLDVQFALAAHVTRADEPRYRFATALALGHLPEVGRGLHDVVVLVVVGQHTSRLPYVRIAPIAPSPVEY